MSSELTEWLGWEAIEAQLTPFILNLVNDKLDQFRPVGGEFLEPLLEAMEMEGYYNLKPACYSSDEINPVVPTCW